MERNQFWIFLGLGLAVGACLEMMKSPSTQPLRLAGFTHFETLLEEGKEVHVIEEVKPLSRGRSTRDDDTIVAQKIAANDAPAPQETTPNSEVTAAATPAPKPLTPEEQKKKDLEDKKKKLKAKRKKREEEKKLREAYDAQLKTDDEKQADVKPTDSDDAAANTDVTFGAPVLNGATSDNGLPRSVREWEAYLMKDVDFARMAKFVQLFQTGLVKADVFYPVIEAMLQDSRPKIRALAIGGLSSTPSTQSYIALLETRNDADPNVRKLTATAIAQYARLENLRYLMSVIVGPYDASTVIEAMRAVKTSADTTVKSLSISAQGNQPTPPPRTPATIALVRYYTPFVAALQQTSRQSHDGSVRTFAAQTLAELQAVILTIPTAPPQRTALNQ